jgi:hypothetical protein
MKRKIQFKPTLPGKRSSQKLRRTTRPREVYLAIRKLLDTTNHIQARAAELETALDILREQERRKALKELLLALRRSPDGDLLRFNPAVTGNIENGTARAIVAALVQAFEITPIHQIGQQIPVGHGEVPASMELDRAIGEDAGNCVAVEIMSPGWKFEEQTLLKPVVRPVLSRSSQPGSVPAGHAIQFSVLGLGHGQVKLPPSGNPDGI